MAAVRRLHPRHSDGRRLRFLTGLALLTLTFGTAAASAPPATAVTTTIEAPAAVAAAGPTVQDEAPRTSPRSEECRHDASRAGREVPPTATLAGITAPAHGSRAPPGR